MGNESFSFKPNYPLNKSAIKSFHFSPLDGNLTTRQILLNGKQLHLTEEDDLPDFDPG
jgi:hypothetical protein